MYNRDIKKFATTEGMLVVVVGGGGGGGAIACWDWAMVCVRKRLISRKLLNQIQKMNMF